MCDDGQNCYNDPVSRSRLIGVEGGRKALSSRRLSSASRGGCRRCCSAVQADEHAKHTLRHCQGHLRDRPCIEVRLTQVKKFTAVNGILPWRWAHGN